MLVSGWLLAGFAWAALCFGFVWPIWDPDYGPSGALFFVVMLFPFFCIILSAIYIGGQSLVRGACRLGLGRAFIAISIVLLAIIWARLSFLVYYGRF
jgi:hypothetical protein